MMAIVEKLKSKFTGVPPAEMTYWKREKKSEEYRYNLVTPARMSSKLSYENGQLYMVTLYFEGHHMSIKPEEVDRLYALYQLLEVTLDKYEELKPAEG